MEQVEEESGGCQVEDAKAAIGSSARKTTSKFSRRGGMGEEDFIGMLHGSDPVRMEFNRLENEVREKNRELAEAHNEIKAIKLIERAKEKALAEATEELQKSILKYQASEFALEDKNLEIKRISEEKKSALAAQFAAEATLRRVHASQKDEELPSVESILFPLEAEVKMLRQEVSKLQEDNRALDRLTKTKEAALLDAERQVHAAKAKAALVDELLNRNQDLAKQNDICQEEYKILDRMHRQKVAEVEKRGQTIKELEEALLSGAAVANAVHDYKRQVNQLKGEKKTLERTLSRVKVSENRAAVAIVNEWKDSDEKMMPVKQWTEERRILMGEMQQLRDKLGVSERTAKAEAQLKEKFQLRLKIVEDSLRSSMARANYGGNNNSGPADKSGDGFSSNGSWARKAAAAVPPGLGRSSSMSRYAASTLKLVKGASRSFDGGSFPEHEERNGSSGDSSTTSKEQRQQSTGAKPPRGDDNSSVAGVLYDLLQKEVVALRKACHDKDKGLRDMESHVEMLSRKIDTLNKALEVETKKMQREKAAMAREISTIRAEKEHHRKATRCKEISSSSAK